MTGYMPRLPTRGSPRETPSPRHLCLRLMGAQAPGASPVCVWGVSDGRASCGLTRVLSQVLDWPLRLLQGEGPTTILTPSLTATAVSSASLPTSPVTCTAWMGCFHPGSSGFHTVPESRREKGCFRIIQTPEPHPRLGESESPDMELRVCTLKASQGTAMHTLSGSPWNQAQGSRRGV